ncbi:hypothetical protein F5Y00DRAFT_261518 [Daldinia vernicosa]|uniref:uncharacterized protein n=1 Tax=Daldinia vernicosa TaxID=114800 RepID=UPI002008AF7D|nr:uncharacterized protein F5Y00DRAFT_261518 [Daldinia vernicosa]KAI0849382.1 hypothetical protein F5Y00DRAFT_261518 [Daldinia vernicosa]
MPGSSNKTIWLVTRETPPKSSHYFSEHPPTSHAADTQSLRDYRLREFRNDIRSVTLADVQAAAASSFGATRSATDATQNARTSKDV